MRRRDFIKVIIGEVEPGGAAAMTPR